ncbi:hypothetical protein E2L06_20875 [Haloterrigena sp. H1]|uniref:hypothetical protein n=1 Tax=Haloterrigena sp. H1 TaxID=2552943 RepID=UPI00110DEDDF|nr:hypothetical protein [Haloterrigena sp. H1]TMT78011.1 hypothetical protein E2L06_20875 [Haloterrigena sp. H1]
MSELDFLDVGYESYDEFDEFVEYIKKDIDLSDIDGKLSLVGSLSDYETKNQFVESLDPVFNVVRDLGNLLLLSGGSNDVPFYVHLNDFCPVFLTTGTKTEDLPATVDTYLNNTGNVSRLWVGKKQMDLIRRSIVQKHPDVRIPYFTAHHSPTSEDNLDGITRPEFERTIQYYGEDGRRAFQEVKHKYGVFPTNVRFKKPNGFKFRITNDGVFTINTGISEPLSIIQSSIDRLREVKEKIKTSEYEEVENEFVPDQNLEMIEPWGIKLNGGLNRRDIDNFEANIQSRNWDFDLSRMNASFGDIPGFRAEIIDEKTYGRAAMRSNRDLIRVYPREHTTFSQFMRIYSFVSDHIDSNAQPVAL